MKRALKTELSLSLLEKNLMHLRLHKPSNILGDAIVAVELMGIGIDPADFQQRLSELAVSRGMSAAVLIKGLSNGCHASTGN
ncbi:hypothetical protein [Sphingobacterium hungaricum]|uniref:Uncharacterized protein n=1 Tax=Sphingobacterium hungaricum TaxID=2082723 RepID=A0A928YQT9_9SPHI|nr:hypothetical protein [Sphingobacterium hungaricum]MBE8712678.1 hypothetical protein [Sphingobacterium hungaricum]